MSATQYALRELAQRASLGREARQHVQPGRSPRALFDTLLAHGLHEDALRLLPYVLPTREAVWWGCLCSWLQGRDRPNPATWNTMPLILRWLNEPSEESRQAVARLANDDTSIGCMALAVSYTGGNLAPADWPLVIAPPEHLTPKVVGCGVLLAAVEYEPMQFVEFYRTFLGLGLNVLEGKSTWKTASIRNAAVEMSPAGA